MDIDCIIIGVNAAKTLQRCIESVHRSQYSKGRVTIWYVDGGSSDESCRIAQNYPDVHVIALQPVYPTPGLGRNAGWQAGTAPLVQFLDADTVLHPDWFSTATAALGHDIGAVRGNREELHPEASVFNWIGSLEWNPPPGDCEAFGGDVLIRRSVLEETNGYDADLVGGEDPELSQRVRLKSWRIIHLNVPMTGHDLAMTTPGQYVRRGYRTGYGYAAVTWRHSGQIRGFWLYESIRILLRGGGGIISALCALTLGHFNPLGFLLLLPALGLILFPRLFRVKHFMQDKHLSRYQAQIYAWHCSLVVLPQFLGILRFIWGKLTDFPLRNRRSSLKTGVSALIAILLILPVWFSCAPRVAPRPNLTPEAVQQQFATEPRKAMERFASSDDVRRFSNVVPERYLIGPGDVLNLTVWQRPDISDPRIVVGPDGLICVTRIGCMTVRGKPIEEIADEITHKLSSFYEKPEVRISILEYKNNKAFVLGRVSNPGVVNFSGRGTLLEALALAGGLPAVTTQDAFLTKCSIIRGRDLIIWVDLRDLLQNGNMALNARIQNDDIIFIPESEDEVVYVMGDVVKPGAIRLKSRLTYLDALMYSGGPTENADLKQTYILRYDNETASILKIDLQAMLETGDMRENYLLQDNDVVYVVNNSISEFNYIMKQLLPSLSVLDLSMRNLEHLGILQELRKQVWGQEGFVND
ncbi:MAG: polysaccharide biosynthesis/export family protein [Desulfatirhabdiaceae bacterium]